MIRVNIGGFSLDLYDKIGYYSFMFISIAHFVLRVALVVTIWAFVWRYMEPKTQLMRVLRAALLVLGLLGALAVTRVICG
jgi:hypothetical protein